MKLNLEDIKRVDLVLMYQEEDVKRVLVMELLRLKCISYLMYMYHVKYAKEKDIAEKL